MPRYEVEVCLIHTIEIEADTVESPTSKTYTWAHKELDALGHDEDSTPDIRVEVFGEADSVEEEED